MKEAMFLIGLPNIYKMYGCISYVKIGISQLFNIKIKTLQKVCSTFWQDLWEAGAGYTGFERTADPGDCVEHVILIKKVVV